MALIPPSILGQQHHDKSPIWLTYWDMRA
jgi:hypothetical protein